MKKNAVRDELGRQRFHGAFTGGFSAGYFNTVGSEEGFRPQTFHSSRSNRAEKKQQTARDFMDEEDGLLGGNLTTKKELDSFLPDHARAPTKSVLDVDYDEFKDEENSKAVRMLLSNLVLEPTNTMGKRILGQMGWKPGMAVGPRVKKSEYSSIPIETRNISTKGIQEGTLTFALREEKSFFDLFPQPKTDTTGIGYVKDGLQDELFDNQGEDEEANRYRVTDLFQKNSTSGSLLKGINEKKPKRKTGSSFLADDDDDIAYDNSFDNYSATAFEIEDDTGLSITKKKQSKDKLSDYIQESKKEQAAEIYRCPSDNRPPLKGFHVALKETQIIQPFYPPPTDIPKDFKAFHVFQVQEEPLTTLSGKKSIFDYLKPEDRQRLLGLAAKQQQRQVSTSLTNETTSSIPPTVGEAVPSVVNNVDSIKNENSIFNLIKPQDRNRILGLAQQIRSSSGNQVQSTADPISIPPPPLPPAIPPPPLPPAIPPPPLAPAENNFFTRFQRPDNVQPIEQSTSNGSDCRPMLVPTHRLNSTFAGLSEAFKNRFTNSSSNTNAEKNPLEPKSVDENVLKEGLTSAEEFAKLLKEKQEKEANKNSSSAPATTESSSSTRTTKKLINRTTILWTPNSLLCKRCHIRPSDTAAPNNMPPPSSSSVSFTTTSASTSTNVNATGFSLEKDPLFSRLFSTGTNNNNDPMNKEREAEIKANLEKERIENEKALQKLIQEFDLYDIYQSSVGEKPDSHVYEIIFNEKDENEILTNENETKEIEKRMREEEEQLLIASEKINSQKNEEISINLSEQIAESVAGMPKFIPKSKRKLNSTEESISSSTTTTSSALKFGSSGFISASSTHKRPLVPENTEEREVKPKTSSSSLRSFADTPPPPPTVQDQDKPIQKKIKKKVRYQEDAVNDQVDEDEQEEIRKLEEASRLLLGESVVDDDDDDKAGKLLNIAAESSNVHENEVNEKRESSSIQIPIALDDDDLFGRPISSMKSLVNVAGDGNDADDNVGGAIVFKKKRTKK